MKLAVIPARGGSKRIQRKNVRPFAGKPMIAYAIEAARAAGVFDRIVVSTDDDEIAAIATDFGADVPFRRPQDLADDHTPTVPVISHAIAACNALGFYAEEICCIYPAVPTIDVHDLIRGLELLRERGEGYVFPVTHFPSPVQRALRRREDGSTEPIWPANAATRTQDLEPAFFDAGQFYWGMREAWVSQLNLHQHGHTLVIPSWRTVDIDTMDDWARAELLYAAWRGRSVP